MKVEDELLNYIVEKIRLIHHQNNIWQEAIVSNFSFDSTKTKQKKSYCLYRRKIYRSSNETLIVLHIIYISCQIFHFISLLISCVLRNDR